MDRKVSTALLALLLLLPCCCALADVVILPDSVKEIGPQAFAGDTSIEAVWLADDCVVAADAFPAGTPLIRRQDTLDFDPTPDTSLLGDEIEQLKSATPAQMRAAVKTVGDAYELLLLLFPRLRRTTAVDSLNADGSLTLRFPDPQELLQSRPETVSDVDIERMAAWLLSDDTRTGVLLLFGVNEADPRPAFGWLDGQLVHPRAVLVVENHAGYTAFRCGAQKPDAWGSISRPEGFTTELPGGNLLSLSQYAETLVPAEDFANCLPLVWVPGGSRFTLRYDPADQSLQTAPGTLFPLS